jgi:Asp-tRNA(Asn)/Glu-tRNA(Gln) amidotransferase A subunit family amidase
MSNRPANFPRLFPPPDETIAGVGRALREGRTTCEQILSGCLAQVDEWEPKVHAWVVLDRDRARAQARSLDDELAQGKDRGALHGIPIGIKDIIDVAGLPTACGAKRWADSSAEHDAQVVTNLRDSGALIMGKTVTTPYAWIDPPITRNPWNLERTPGGSSSGSAAAVACGMCLGAIGTQTGGSIIRPASFCGVAGMKPGKLASQFVIRSGGIKPFARSLDHVGPVARTVGDVLILYTKMMGSDYIKTTKHEPSHSIPRFGRLRGFFDRRADSAVRSVTAEAYQLLGSHGADIVDMDDPVDFERVLRDHRTVMAAEAAEVHSAGMDEFPDDYPPRIRDLIREGRGLMAVEYVRALRRRHTAEAQMMATFERMEGQFWITPATPGTAPDLSTTGDPAFNSPWSYTGLPTVSFPVGLAPDGLPVAIQLIGWPRNQDQALLEAAHWCEQAIRSARQ